MDSFYYRINRPGGHGKITKVEQQEDDQVRLTVKYVLGGFDKDLDPCLIEVPEELGTRDRKRRTLLIVSPPSGADEAKKKPKKKNAPTSAAAVSSSKENTQNHRKQSVLVATTCEPPAKQQRETPKKKVVQAKRRRSFKNKTRQRTNSTNNDKLKWPADLPLEITVHPRPAFASPMNEKGVEDRRKYMLVGGGAAGTALPRSTPSTVYARSAVALCRDEDDDVGVEENDPLSHSNPQPANMEEKSEASSPSNQRMSLDKAAAGTIQRVTLQSVVDREMKEAANFVQDVLHHKKPGDRVVAAAKKQPQAVAKKAKPAAPKASPRQEELMAVFLSLMEHNEGTAEEDCLAAQLNQQSQGTKDFTEVEVKTLMDSLAVSNKIMRCDGSIYWL